MKPLLQYLFCLVVLYGSCYAALKDCADSKCPAGGIWSEWSSTEQCQTACGSCSKAYYTRTCLTSNIEGCNCTGDNSRFYPCNTQTCAYPAQRTCCIPYVSMVLNGKSQCGPLPRETTVTSCCPIGGLWSTWSSYFRNLADTAYQRTRKCLVEDAGCQCSGVKEETSAVCPCRPLIDPQAVKDLLTTPTPTLNAKLVPVLNENMDSNVCKYEAEVDTSSGFCSSWRSYTSTTVMRYIIPTDTSKYEEQRLTNCSEAGTGYIQMYCDLETLNWRLFKTNKEVYAWSQIEYYKRVV